MTTIEIKLGRKQDYNHVLAQASPIQGARFEVQADKLRQSAVIKLHQQLSTVEGTSGVIHYHGEQYSWGR